MLRVQMQAIRDWIRAVAARRELCPQQPKCLHVIVKCVIFRTESRLLYCGQSRKGRSARSGLRQNRHPWSAFRSEFIAGTKPHSHAAGTHEPGRAVERGHTSV